MEYRIFGAAPGASALRDDLAVFCALDENQREAIEAWLLANPKDSEWAPALPPNIAASTLLPDQFRQGASALRQLLAEWQRRDLDLVDIERDLLLLGVGAEQINLVSGFLSRLSSIKEAVWVTMLERSHQVLGLPTVDDVNILWNARPVFGGPTYYYFDSDSDKANYNKLLDLTMVAVIEIVASGVDGAKTRTSIQVNEETFRRLIKAMERSSEQLETLKKYLKLTDSNKNA